MSFSLALSDVAENRPDVPVRFRRKVSRSEIARFHLESFKNAKDGFELAEKYRDYVRKLNDAFEELLELLDRTNFPADLLEVFAAEMNVKELNAREKSLAFLHECQERISYIRDSKEMWARSWLPVYEKMIENLEMELGIWQKARRALELAQTRATIAEMRERSVGRYKSSTSDLLREVREI